MKENKAHNYKNASVYRILIIVCSLIIIALAIIVHYNNPTNKIDSVRISEETKLSDSNHIVDGVHVRTGLLEGDGLQEVINNCTSCHSSKLIIQNRMNKEQWYATIRWMQETQGLWDLGDDQEIIVDYLTQNYPPFKKGRREVLSNIEWYMIN
ncbi:monoheme cytochrome C [Maribacter sp. 2304DJ31-5]|uniref:monoheme cytochrome C n=1 Tax=Maribacter sp. 2304DJ31-5 TaxID=3386273 RepID=UPI0039BD2EC2